MSDTLELASDVRTAVESAALSDVGLRRGNNQDSYVVALAADDADWQRRGHLLMVADGMGAHAAGELASKLACESVPLTYRKRFDRSPEEALQQAVVAANATIHDRGQANAEFQGMGTTCSTLVLLPRAAIVAHVGDSRVYRLRKGKLEQLTFDHSLVWEMLAAGQMPRGEAANFIPKNIITRSLGPHGEVQVDLEGPFPLEVGDVFMLCSDGLSGQLKDEEIGSILSVLSPQEAVQALVDMANLRGGPDNVTVLVARIRGVPPSDPQQPATTSLSDSAGDQPPRSKLWLAVAACLAVCLGLAVANYLVAALVGGLVAALLAVVALTHGASSYSGARSSSANGPLGSGPHVTQDSTPGPESVAVVCQMAQQLREAAKDEHWTLDWGRFNNYGQQAQAALSQRDYARAVREYALAISFMMSEIRRQPPGRDQRGKSALEF